MNTTWANAQKWEQEWWGSCINTYGEETKQLHYAERMGLNLQHNSQGFHVDMEGKSVLDIGSGAVSFLLKCTNVKGTAEDPMPMPKWVLQRYEEAGITFLNERAEDLDKIFFGSVIFDEVWMYNVLQHTENPEKIVKNARALGKIVRVFDWLEIGVAPGHPQNLLEDKMNEWFGGEGRVEIGNGGKEYFGIFKGDSYHE